MPKRNGNRGGDWSKKPPRFALKKLQTKHQLIMWDLLKGKSQNAIAKKRGMTAGRISIIVNSPLFKSELKNLREAVKKELVSNKASIEERLESLQGKSLDTFEEVLDNPKVPLKLKKETAKDILVLSGIQHRRVQAKDGGVEDYTRFVAESFAEAQRRRNLKLAAQNAAAEKDEKAERDENGNGNGQKDVNININVGPQDSVKKFDPNAETIEIETVPRNTEVEDVA